MNSDRRFRLWRVVVEHAQRNTVTIEDVCAAMVSEAGVDGAAITVTLPMGARETLYASDLTIADLAELALTLGEGPNVDAYAGGPALAADLTDVDSQNRWPVFAPAAVGVGARAVFALPLQVGGAQLGVADLYRARPGPLTPTQLSDGLILADTACGLLLDTHRDGSGAGDGREPLRVGLQHPEVHQATGMIIAQLGVSAAVALIRLRAYAYSHDRHLRDVAGDVVARRLRFHRDDPALASGDESDET